MILNCISNVIRHFLFDNNPRTLNENSLYFVAKGTNFLRRWRNDISCVIFLFKCQKVLLIKHELQVGKTIFHIGFYYIQILFIRIRFHPFHQNHNVECWVHLVKQFDNRDHNINQRLNILLIDRFGSGAKQNLTWYKIVVSARFRIWVTAASCLALRAFWT